MQDREVFRLVPSIVPTARAQDAELVPLSFQYRESDFSEVILWCFAWCCKIMVSGLCQTLLASGVKVKWPTLAELHKEERRCAMLLCMHADYAASLAPYGCAPFILCCQVAWGVYWRQKDLQLDINGNAMAEWLLRRGNEFMRYWNAFDMQTEGMIFFTERLMGGPILQSDQKAHDKVISTWHPTPTKDQLGRSTAIAREVQDSSCVNESAITDKLRLAQEFKEMLDGPKMEGEMSSLFESSLHTTRCELKQVWREDDFKRAT